MPCPRAEDGMAERAPRSHSLPTGKARHGRLRISSPEVLDLRRTDDVFGQRLRRVAIHRRRAVWTSLSAAAAASSCLDRSVWDRRAGARHRAQPGRQLASSFLAASMLFGGSPRLSGAWRCVHGCRRRTTFSQVERWPGAGALVLSDDIGSIRLHRRHVGV